MDCFHVVEFGSEDVAIVPTSWLHLGAESDELLCYWPPYTSDKTTRAVKAKIAAQKDWEVYPCRELGKSGMFCMLCLLIL